MGHRSIIITGVLNVERTKMKVVKVVLIISEHSVWIIGSKWWNRCKTNTKCKTRSPCPCIRYVDIDWWRTCSCCWCGCWISEDRSWLSNWDLWLRNSQWNIQTWCYRDGSSSSSRRRWSEILEKFFCYLNKSWHWKGYLRICSNWLWDHWMWSGRRVFLFLLDFLWNANIRDCIWLRILCITLSRSPWFTSNSLHFLLFRRLNWFGRSNHLFSFTSLLRLVCLF